jgi:ectoine hydroxylase-related dioxygenase (phytanoyl-CoA dioxygenase family)
MTPSKSASALRSELLPTEKDVQFFEENGYWIGPRILDEDRLERLRDAMERVYQGESETGFHPWSASWAPGDDPKALRKTDNALWANLTIRALALDETIGAMAARLMGTSEVRLWHDQLLHKPGQGAAGVGRSGNIGWHQDHAYWRCTTPDLITAWMPFDDVSLANGCMQFVPGSNCWGLIDASNFFETDLETLGQKIEAATGREFRTVPVILRAGQPSFHHCLTIHGSGPNTTDRPRRSLAIHLMPANAHYVADTASDDHMNAQLLLRLGGKHGDLFRGGLFPKLFPRDDAQVITPGPRYTEISSFGA